MEIHLEQGFDEELRDLERSFQGLNESMQTHLYGKMTYKMAKTVTDEARTTPRFKDDEGTLRKSIRPKRRDDIAPGGKVIKKGAAAATIGAPHGHLLEHGTADRTQTTTGRDTGKVEPRHIMRDALESKQEQALDAGLAEGKKEFGKFVEAARTGKMNKSVSNTLSS